MSQASRFNFPQRILGHEPASNGTPLPKPIYRQRNMDGDFAHLARQETTQRRMYIPGNREVIALWPQIERLIGPLIEDERLYDPVHILQYHLNNQMFIFVGMYGGEVEMAIVANVVKYPKMTVCQFPYAAGKNLRKWIPFYFEVCEGFAKTAGCKGASGGFRRGWIKTLGYKDLGVRLAKELV